MSNQVKQKVTVQNKLGLHARASAKIVEMASKYSAEIKIKHGQKSINGKSIMNVMMLAASKGTQLEIIAEGDEAENAVEALVTLINNKFGEE